MIAGRMKIKLTLLEPVATTNPYGEKTVVWTSRATVHAERVRQSGFRKDEVGEHFPDHAATFNIRSAHTVGENWRVQQLGGNLYTVVAINPNADRGYNELICERVNA